MARPPVPRSAALDQALEAFARWRATRTRQTAPTPVALRRAAVALLATERPTTVARTLSIDPISLRRWADEQAPSAPPASASAAPPVTGGAPRFVALALAHHEPAPTPGANAPPELTLRWPGGAELLARGPVPRPTLAALLDAIAADGQGTSR